jgi:hypothetical protein
MVGTRRTHPGGRPQKYFLDDRGQKLIMELYDGSKKQTVLIAMKLGVPDFIVRKWAGKLVKRGFNWSQEETDFLEENFPKMTPEKIAEHLGRTVNAVRGRMQRMQLYKVCKNGYTMQDLMLGFGIGDHRKIKQWIDNGWLKGKKLSMIDSPARQQHWSFKDKNVRDFIIAHPDQIDQHKIDWLWVVDILAGDKGIGRLDDDRYGERQEKE